MNDPVLGDPTPRRETLLDPVHLIGGVKVGKVWVRPTSTKPSD